MKRDPQQTALASSVVPSGLIANLSCSLDRLKSTVDHALPAVRCAPSQSVCCPPDLRHASCLA